MTRALAFARLPLLASAWLAGPALRAAPRRYAAATRRYAGSSALEVLVPIADGSEEIETTCITDTLVRAGASVTVASVTGTGKGVQRGRPNTDTRRRSRPQLHGNCL